MFLPQTLQLFGQTLPITSIFIIAAIIYFFFVVWYEGNKDGFDIEIIFNIFFLGTIISLVITYGLFRYLSWAEVYSYKSILLKLDKWLFVSISYYLLTFLSIVIYARIIKWSYFKIADIYSLAVSSALMIYSVGELVVHNKILLFIFVIFTVLMNKYVIVNRSYLLPSVTSFVILNTSLGVYIGFMNKVNGQLPVAILLVTLSFVVLYLRYKEGNMKTNIPQELLEHLKNRLINKDNELKAQEKLIKEEDPYLQPGRAEDNAEIMDEAILEDSRKELSDAKSNVITSVRLQIRKALAYIKIGRYGVCEVCGNQIDNARLHIYPEATKCASCSDKLE